MFHVHILSVCFIWIIPVLLFGVNYFNIGRTPSCESYLYTVGGEFDKQRQFLACLGEEWLSVACLRDAFQQFPIVVDVDPYPFACSWGKETEGRDDVFLLGIEGTCQAMNGFAAVVS